jgi:hypothetical protein
MICSFAFEQLSGKESKKKGNKRAILSGFRRRTFAKVENPAQAAGTSRPIHHATLAWYWHALSFAPGRSKGL